MGKPTKRQRKAVEGIDVVALEQGAMPAACRTWRGMLEVFGRAKPVEATGGVPLVSRHNGRLKISRRAEKVLAGRPFAIRLYPRRWLDGFVVRGEALEMLRGLPTFCGFVLRHPRARRGRCTNDVKFSIFVKSRSAAVSDKVFEIGKATKAEFCLRVLEPAGSIMTKLIVPEANFDRTIVRLERLVAKQRRPVRVGASGAGFLRSGPGAVVLWRKGFASEVGSWVEVESYSAG
jgi:hypothetical protein